MTWYACLLLAQYPVLAVTVLYRIGKPPPQRRAVLTATPALAIIAIYALEAWGIWELAT